jgi:hypothetical protein
VRGWLLLFSSDLLNFFGRLPLLQNIVASERPLSNAASIIKVAHTIYQRTEGGRGRLVAHAGFSLIKPILLMTFRSPAKIQAALSENKMSHIKARF